MRKFIKRKPGSDKPISVLFTTVSTVVHQSDIVLAPQVRVSGNGCDDLSARLQNAVKLRHSGAVVRQMLQDVHRDERIKGVVSEREIHRIRSYQVLQTASL